MAVSYHHPYLSIGFETYNIPVMIEQLKPKLRPDEWTHSQTRALRFLIERYYQTGRDETFRKVLHEFFNFLGWRHLDLQNPSIISTMISLEEGQFITETVRANPPELNPICILSRHPNAVSPDYSRWQEIPGLAIREYHGYFIRIPSRQGRLDLAPQQARDAFIHQLLTTPPIGFGTIPRKDFETVGLGCTPPRHGVLDEMVATFDKPKDLSF